MTTELEQYLKVRGFSARPEQTRLYAALIQADKKGVLAQAGTGTGKSAAIIAAAAHMCRKTGQQSVIVTPTNMLATQYRDGELPYAKDAFPDLEFAEVRGKSHYYCEATEQAFKMVGAEYKGGCDGGDSGCTAKTWGGHDETCMDKCDIDHGHPWQCDYRMARQLASEANVVVTNADMLIVNDNILSQFGQEFIDLDGSIFVDEAHTLEGKLRDYASRSLTAKRVRAFKYAEKNLTEPIARWLERQLDAKEFTTDDNEAPIIRLRELAETKVPEKGDDGKTNKKAEQLVESVKKILHFIDNPSDHAVLHVGDESFKLDWINVSAAARDLLTKRRVGLVSATIPRSMASTLGMRDAQFVDVGHPFDYGKQAWIGFSAYSGAFGSAQNYDRKTRERSVNMDNLNNRLDEIKAHLLKAKGGALFLFSAFSDLNDVADALTPWIEENLGCKVLRQTRELEPEEREAMAKEFKEDGNAILFGSSSFATGFDAPGAALRFVVLWKMPFPMVSPVMKRIQEQNERRYQDIMRVTAVQSIGRLIRTTSDKGLVWIADNRGRSIVDPSDPMTKHICEFQRM